MKYFLKSFLTLCILTLTCATAGAQKDEELKKQQDNQVHLQDSARIAQMQQEVQQMKLNELIYLEELDKTKSKYVSDSVRKAKYKGRIDSLRMVSTGAPVIVDGDTLFTIYAARGGVSYKDRAENTARNVTTVGKTRNAVPDSIYLLKLESGNQIEIMHKGKVLTSVTNDDALWMDVPIDTLAKVQKATIIDSVVKLQKKYSLLQSLKRVGLFTLIILVLGAAIYTVNRARRRIKKFISAKAKKTFKPIKIKDYEFLNTQRQISLLLFGVNIMRWFVIVLLLMLAIPMIFSVFPPTKSLAMVLFSWILTPIKSIFYSIVDYLPKLIRIIIICLCFKYLIRGIKFLAGEIENEKLRIPGFYADWARPTFTIVRFLLYAFMMAMIYNYLPGADNSVFQGISVFVGLIVSLGGASAISNMISGMVITYMRPFKLGDQIKLNDTIGNVVEKSAFVTRLRTPKNEVITVPNAFIMSSQTTNYTASAQEYGLIIHASIGIGYDIPWQKVHECLVRAAKATKGTLQDREPFVLELQFRDFDTLYQINAYVDHTNNLSEVYSQLHQNIQDVFNQQGIPIETPFLKQDRSDTYTPRADKLRELQEEQLRRSGHEDGQS